MFIFYYRFMTKFSKHLIVTFLEYMYLLQTIFISHILKKLSLYYKIIKINFFFLQMGDIKYYGKRRSIVRKIGSFLPLKPPPKIYVSVTPLHLMTNSMINEETSNNYVDKNGYPMRSIHYSVKL